MLTSSTPPRATSGWPGLAAPSVTREYGPFRQAPVATVRRCHAMARHCRRCNLRLPRAPFRQVPALGKCNHTKPVAPDKKDIAPWCKRVRGVRRARNGSRRRVVAVGSSCAGYRMTISGGQRDARNQRQEDKEHYTPRGSSTATAGYAAPPRARMSMGMAHEIITDVTGMASDNTMYPMREPAWFLE